MAIQMTREEYRRKYGVDPVMSSSTLDTKPAPIRMTRAEYDSIYGQTQPASQSLGARLEGRASQFGESLTANKYPGQPVVGGLGAIAGGINDVIGATLEPVFRGAVEKISDVPLVQRVAGTKPVSKALDVTNVGVQQVGESWKGFEEKNPTTAQFAKDVANISALLPVGGVASKARSKIAPALDERVIVKRAEELAKLEGKYAKTRKANQFADDAGEASRRRIAQTDVLVNVVDENGLIRTKNPGGAIDQYKAQTLDGVENIVRKNLEQSKDVVDLSDVKTYLTREVMDSGLEGGDLVRALKGINSELAGLSVRTKGNNVVDLTYLQDAKIGTTKNINYLTPPETAAYRKAVARAYKNIIEDKSSVKIEVDGKLFGVKDVNAKLAEFYKDIRRLENLDGTRVEGGKLGKYLAQGLGTAVGMGAGSVGGAAGSVVGGLAGGELAAFLKGKAMAGTFGRATGKTAPKSALLERAKLKIPDAKVMAPKNITKTKEITSLEDDIAKNVDAQKKAIAKGDFTLVATLKQIYVTLVEALKSEIAKIKEMAKGQGERGFANFFDNGQRVRNSNQSQAITPPTKAQNISPTVPPTPKASSASVGKADTSGGFEGVTSVRPKSSESPERSLQPQQESRVQAGTSASPEGNGASNGSTPANNRESYTYTTSKPPLEKRASQFSTADEFIKGTRGEFLFHGTPEQIVGDLRGGSFDKVLWTSDRPDVAQGYITSDQGGRLYALHGTKELNIFDATKRGHDLQNPAHLDAELLNKARREGYDGIKIDDYMQDKNWGNVGHHSIGLFESGIKKLKQVGDTEASHFTFGDSLARTDTPEATKLLTDIYNKSTLTDIWKKANGK